MKKNVIAVVAMATWLVGCQQAETTNGVDLSETSPVDETVETEEVETEDVEKEEAEAEEEGEEVEEGGETAEEEAGVSEEGDVATGEVEAEPAEAPSSDVRVVDEGARESFERELYDAMPRRYNPDESYGETASHSEQAADAMHRVMEARLSLLTEEERAEWNALQEHAARELEVAKANAAGVLNGGGFNIMVASTRVNYKIEQADWMGALLFDTPPGWASALAEQKASDT